MHINKETQFEGPPWPLEKVEVDWFKEIGLTELAHELHVEASKISDTRFRILYTKEK